MHTELPLTHWGQVKHICVSKLTIIGSDNGLWPRQCKVVTWINAGILLIGSLGTNFSEIFIEIYSFHSRKCIWKWRTFCLWLIVLNNWVISFQTVNLFYHIIHFNCNISVWNRPSTVNIQLAVWVLMAWCFSTRASVATVPSMHPCILSCLWDNIWT